MGSGLLYSGLVLYILNYSIGWGLNLNAISISRRTHQVIYSLLIINVFFLLFFIDLSSRGFIFALLSLMMLFILPFGKKGGTYHKITSTIGFLSYLLCVF